ncbi:MAG: translation initiation factor IF-3 [Patescibacteria group bacterium]|nr:MAG: translation initiation factor IF-3 [Patescibacteria group bacterium]
MARRRRKKIKKTRQPSYRINEMIRAAQVRVIDKEDKQVGILDIGEALQLAREKGLDLIEVAPSAKPPVVKLLDFKRWLFQKEKQKKKGRERGSVLKEFRIRPNISDHDLEVRISRAEKFLKGGDKVKLTVVFRGREFTHPEVGLEKIKRVTAFLKEVGKPEKDPERLGRGYEVTFVPIKNG